jgi:hypothetical protein
VDRNAEHLAWTVLVSAFCVFVLMLVAIPKAIDWYYAAAMTERPVRLQVLHGTALWLPPGARQEVNADGQSTLSEGDQIRTAANSEVLLSFFDGTNVRLWPNTIVRILRTSSSTYRAADTEVVLAQDQGHARYNVALPATASRQFEVQTPSASSLLREGSYKIEATADHTEVTVASGSATVSGGQRAVEVLTGEWTQVVGGGAPSRPTSDLHNLVVNGDFSQGLSGWQPGNRDVEDNVQGDVGIRAEDNRTFAEFVREGSDKHAETFLHQALDQDVTDYDVLKFNFQLRVLAQSLPGGGTLGSEFPIIVRIHYRDANGSENTWYHGFYLEPGSPSSPLPAIANADGVTQNLWTDESFNLLDPNVVNPRPAEILWIEVAASGHAYQSDVAAVQLMVD